VTKAKVPSERDVKKMSVADLKKTAVALFPDVFPDGGKFDKTRTPWTLWEVLRGQGWYLSLDYIESHGNDAPEVFASRKGKDIPYPITNLTDPTPTVLRVAVLCRRYDLRGDKG
jgi:hypothetical protein